MGNSLGIEAGGIAFHEAGGCRLIIDELPLIDSPLADAIKLKPVKVRNVVAHSRKATRSIDDLGLQVRSEVIALVKSTEVSIAKVQ